MFQVANLMQSETLEVFFRPSTGFPAGHQVYDLHNDGNSVLHQLYILSMKSQSRANQSRWKWYHSIDWVWFSI